MKDYYTLKEIVFGLRKEQLRIAKKLKLLESKLSVYNDKQYKESSFNFDWVKGNVKLVYRLHEKYRLLDNLLNVITFRFKNISNGKDYVEELRKLDNGDYKIGGLGGLKATVFSDEQESFNEIIDELLKDEFVNNVSLRYMGDMKSNYAKTLFLNPVDGFCVSKGNGSNGLFYGASRDDMVLLKTSSRNKTYQDVINEILEVKFPRKLFSEYIQFIIDNNDETKKDVIIYNNRSYTKEANFYINDERDAFVLVKKK